MIEPSAHVRLTVDLTRYLPGLVAGAHGIVFGPASAGGADADRFVGVCFPGIGAVDIAKESLEFVEIDLPTDGDARLTTLLGDASVSQR
jgi:hypothetical protein